MVYVDSGSTDGSVERSESLGVEVLKLSPPRLTAARGRQAGLDFLVQRYPDLQFVQFIDGDCELNLEWIERAMAEMERDSAIAAISGIRRETRMEENRWSRLVDIEWSKADGEVLYPGGDSLCRIVALNAIGGWSTELIAGEDPDLGFRLVDHGWKVRRLAVPMTKHDIRITRFSQYWKRAVRSGFAYGIAGWRNRYGAGKGYMIKGLKFSLQAITLIASFLFSFFLPPLMIVTILLVAVITSRATLYGYSQGLDIRDSITYGCLCVFVRIAQLRGFVKAILHVAIGNEQHLIEYAKNE
jgi:cellulose synthase/poly-beta-1,6-N-acetylglucosamine synthase-like glycosyltransferase